MAAPPTGPALELRGVSKYYGRFPAVRDLDLTIPRGATYGVLGPNGAGKTTTIRMALRILEPDSGSIDLLGQTLSQEGLDRVGYLPEERGVYRRMKVRDLLSFLAELKGMNRRDARPEIDRWLERMDLGAWADRKVQDLSKGMQQKIQFIGAVLHDPELIVLDEPFSGLDPINQQVLREIVVELKRANRTIIFSTHIIEHAERICDHVCIIAQGRKVADGTVKQLKQEHGGDYVAISFERPDIEAERLLGALPTVAGVRQHGTVAEVGLQAGADPQELLVHLVNQGVRLRRFECTEPSLEEIFLERVAAAEPRPEVREEELAHV
ncbi:MAG TPA: ATP-binding cassette domain-containing protein [Longimicrobiales bacterium]|nr:ATP-binding cassette domain-containing protein [Longimicrobiales bacterium]